MNKIKIIILGLIVLVFLLFFYSFSPVIFQEGNPIPLVRGIVELNFSQNDIVALDEKEGKFLTKSKNGKEILIEKLNNQGYEFVGQMGSGYLFKKNQLDKLIATHKYYSQFYSIWSLTKSENIRDSIEWLEYKNKEYEFVFKYPSLSIGNHLWGDLPDGVSISEVLSPNQVLSKENNFYLCQKYKIATNWKTGEITKTENTFIPEYKSGDSSYPLPWHIVILEAKNEKELDKAIKQRLGSGCSYKEKIPTEFNGNYRVEIKGDGKDLGSTACPVNYMNYIVYSPAREKVAFWSTGQECQIGLGFIYPDCFDKKISNSFHFLN